MNAQDKNRYIRSLLSEMTESDKDYFDKNEIKKEEDVKMKQENLDF